jgi:hypothetical protein
VADEGRRARRDRALEPAMLPAHGHGPTSAIRSRDAIPPCTETNIGA